MWTNHWQIVWHTLAYIHQMTAPVQLTVEHHNWEEIIVSKLDLFQVNGTVAVSKDLLKSMEWQCVYQPTEEGKAP